MYATAAYKYEITTVMIPSSPITIHDIRFPRITHWNYSKMKAPFSRFYWHPEPQTYVTIQGSKEIELKPERVYLVPRGTQFSSRSTAQFTHFHIYFHCIWNLTPGILSMPMRSDTKDTLLRILDIGDSDPESSEMSYLGYRLLYLVFDDLEPEQRQPHPDSERLQNAANYIFQNYRHSVSNEELAKISRMSVNHFIRTFKNVYGTTPQQYVIIRRCEHASSLLGNKRFSIEEIAEHTGFYDRYHFTRMYKKYRGITPAAYRTLRNI